MIDGGWICRSCWHANRPIDARCYRCHTPRGDGRSESAGSVTEPSPKAPIATIRLDTDLPFLTLLATLPMRLYAALSIGGGVLIAMLGLLGRTVGLILVALGVVSILFGIFLIFLANRVGRHARWAYAVAFPLFLIDSLPTLLGVAKPAFPNSAASVALLVSAWVSFGIAVCVGALLLTSFVRQAVE